LVATSKRLSATSPSTVAAALPGTTSPETFGLTAFYRLRVTW